MGGDITSIGVTTGTTAAAIIDRRRGERGRTGMPPARSYSLELRNIPLTRWR